MNVDRMPAVLLKKVKRPLWMLSRKLGGPRIQATVHFRDMGLYGGVFEAPAERVQARLPPGFEVLEPSPGVAALHVYAFDYRQIDWLEPYRELAVLTPARFTSAEQDVLDGQYFFQLPVTSEEARWTGVENFGFPKFVADIQIRNDSGSRVCTVDHGGQHVLTMRVASVPLVKSTMPGHNLTVRGDGMVIASVFDIEGPIGHATARGSVYLELGNHAMSDQLRELGIRLDTGRAIYAPRVGAVLMPGTEVAPLPASQAGAVASPLQAALAAQR